MFSRWRQRQ
uniref:Uncharacterized protein n=1 Tax=Anguilla anguilla TaxID=7936 RepID=A0A0E9PCU7_ANGAN